LKHLASARFWACYRKLPAEIQELADRSYRRLRDDPRHPSLQFKKLGAVWSVPVGAHYRTLGVQVEVGILWLWIGTHADYDRLSR
jgi:hypothetical protein